MVHSRRKNEGTRVAPRKNFLVTILANIGWPLLWGLAAWVAFYALLHRGLITTPLVLRYFAGHPVEYIEAAMFFVGMAALVGKMVGVCGHYMTLGSVRLPPIPDGGQPASASTELLDELSEQPPRIRNSCLGRRLQDALEYVTRKGSADGLDDQLKHLSDLDAGRLYEANGLLRTIVWATPMLGFLGTVIGITLALGGLSPQLLAESPEEATKGLLAGLSIAFDTTTLALSLSLLLMFVWFLADQFETQLLEAVDSRTESELVGRFEQLGTRNDPHVASIRQMSESVVRNCETLVHRQSEIWQGTIDAAHRQWNELVGTAGGQLQQSFAQAMAGSLKSHAEQLTQAENIASDRNRQLSRDFQQVLGELTGGLQNQHAEMAKQSEVLQKAVQATGDVIRLEQALNQNLKSLAGAKNFEDTVMSLAAAIHLLNSRLSATSFDEKQIDLTEGTSKSQDRAA